MTLTFDLKTVNLECPTLCFHKIRSFYGFPLSKKSDELDGWTDGSGAMLDAAPRGRPHNSEQPNYKI